MTGGENLFYRGWNSTGESIFYNGWLEVDTGAPNVFIFLYGPIDANRIFLIGEITS